LGKLKLELATTLAIVVLGPTLVVRKAVPARPPDTMVGVIVTSEKGAFKVKETPNHWGLGHEKHKARLNSFEPPLTLIRMGAASEATANPRAMATPKGPNSARSL